MVEVSTWIPVRALATAHCPRQHHMSVFSLRGLRSTPVHHVLYRGLVGVHVVRPVLVYSAFAPTHGRAIVKNTIRSDTTSLSHISPRPAPPTRPNPRPNPP